MALTDDEERLLSHALAALPSWFTSTERGMEHLAASAKVIGSAKVQLEDWFGNSLITTAVGPTATDPDWLGQHAIDRGTSRQDGESDEALRDRIRNVPEALTRPSILAAAQSIVDAEGIGSLVSVEMVELRIDQAYFGDYESDTGTGGEFEDLGSGQFKFTPSVGFANPPIRTPLNAQWGTPLLVASGASSPVNSGSFPVLSLDEDGVVFIATGVAEVDSGVSWELRKRDGPGNQIVSGRAKSYFKRGYRMHGKPRSAIILILPFGCTAGTRASILEMLRQKAGAGLGKQVECRANP